MYRIMASLIRNLILFLATSDGGIGRCLYVES